MSEPDRNELYRSLEGAIGAKPTATLMTMLARAGREDLATKQDLASEIAGVRQEIADLRVEMHRMLRSQLIAIIGFIAVFNGSMFAALKVF